MVQVWQKAPMRRLCAFWIFRLSTAQAASDPGQKPSLLRKESVAGTKRVPIVTRERQKMKVLETAMHVEVEAKGNVSPVRHRPAANRAQVVEHKNTGSFISMMRSQRKASNGFPSQARNDGHMRTSGASVTTQFVMGSDGEFEPAPELHSSSEHVPEGEIVSKMIAVARHALNDAQIPAGAISAPAPHNSSLLSSNLILILLAAALILVVLNFLQHRRRILQDGEPPLGTESETNTSPLAALQRVFSKDNVSTSKEDSNITSQPVSETRSKFYRERRSRSSISGIVPPVPGPTGTASGSAEADVLPDFRTQTRPSLAFVQKASLLMEKKADKEGSGSRPSVSKPSSRPSLKDPMVL